MKKLLSILLVVTIIFGSMANFSLLPWGNLLVTSFATDSDEPVVPFVSEATSADGGVSVSLKLKPDITNLSGAIVHIVYDTSILECSYASAATDETGEAVVSGLTEGGLLNDGTGYGIGYMNTDGFTTGSEYMDFYNLNLVFLSSEAESAQVTVYCNESVTDDGNDSNDVPCDSDYVIGEYTVVNNCTTDIENAVTINHKVTDGTVTLEPTCNTTGIIIGNCDMCGISTEGSVPVNEHNYTTIFDYDTCQKILKCSDCGNKVTTTITANDILTFTLNSDGTAYTVTDCDSLYKGSLEIPSEYNGLPVVGIGTDALRDCTNITKVDIPDSVVTIGGSAFRSCTSLTSIAIPAGVTTISGAIFNGCTKLESVIIPSGVLSVGGYAFGSCTALKYVFFSGDETAWSSVTIGSSNTALTGAYIHYNSTGEHTYSDEWTVDIEPTCDEVGVKSLHCLYCDIKKDETTIAENGHSYGEVQIVKDPTCEEYGELAKICSVCGTTLAIDPNEFVIVDSSEYPESAHNYTNNLSETYDFSYEGAELLVITFSASTQTESGYDYIYLYGFDGALIGQYDGTTLAGQTFEIEGSSFSVKLTSDSSVNAYGFSFDEIIAYTSYVADCPDVSPLGHSYGDWVIDTPATCLEDGEKSKVCSNCGDVVTETIEAVGYHTYGEWTVETDYTCTEDGVMVQVCEACGDAVRKSGKEGYTDILIDSFFYPVPEYSEDEMGESAEYNYYYTYEGSKTPNSITITFSDDSCVGVCGSVTIYDGSGKVIKEYYDSDYDYNSISLSGETVTIPGDSFRIRKYVNYMEGSDYTLGIASITAEVDLTAAHRFGAYETTIEPTFLEDGLEVSTCSGCGLTKERVAQALYKEKLTLKLNSDKTGYIITDCDTAISGDIVLPSEHNGIPIVAIGDRAFNNCSFIKSLVIPDSITSIGSYAFGYCLNLYSLELPGSITDISYGALNYSLITNLTVNNDYCMNNLRFDYCIPYFGYTPLTVLNIGPLVTKINVEELSWYDNDSLLFENINVSADNEYFSSIDGVLYNKEQTEILCCPMGKTEVTIADTVTVIGERAFARCTGLTSVTIPSGVEKISDYSFIYCKGLTSLVIPSSVKEIGSQAFGSCTSLAEITLSEGIKEIGSHAFYNCSSLTDIELPSSIESLYYNTFYSCPAVTLTVNNNYCASNIDCDSFCLVDEYDEGRGTLETMIIGPDVDNVTYDGGSMDGGGINAKNVVVDEANEAFCVVDGVLLSKDKTKLVYYPWGCSDEYVIPESVTAIGSNAFYTKLAKSTMKSLHIHSKIEMMEDYAFGYSNSKKIENLYIEDISSWCAVDFENVNANPINVSQNVYFDGQQLTDVVIPGTVERIGDYAFCGYDNMKSFTVENGVEGIGYGILWDCNNLDTVYLPESIVEIDDYVFYNCSVKNIYLNNNYCVNYIDFRRLYNSSEVVVNIGENIDDIDASQFKAANVVVNESNQTYCVVDGVVFSKDRTKLVYYPWGCSSEYAIPEHATVIGSYAFVVKMRNGEGFDSLTVHGGINSIENGAFEIDYHGYGIDNLYIENLSAWCSIDFGDYGSNPFKYTQNVYFDGKKIRDLVIPGDATAVKSFAFYGYNDIETVVFENGVESIGSYVFDYCKNLRSVYLPESITEISYNAFEDCYATEVTVNNNYSANNIDFTDFYERYDVVLVLGEKVDGIDASKINAFNIALAEDNVNYSLIDGVVFSSDKTKLIYYPICCAENYSIPENTTTLGDFAFYAKLNYTGFESITIGNGVTKIEKDAFKTSYWKGIENLYLPDVVAWCGITFVNEYSSPVSVAENIYFDGSLITELVIPSTVTKIGKYAFCDFDALTSLVIKAGAESIGDYAFKGCDNLETADIAGSVKIINRGAFIYCRKLGDITLHPGVEKLGHYSFYEAPAEVDKAVLREITIPATTTYISRYAFSNLETITGAEGSYAQQFAENLVYDFIPCIHTIENSLCIHCGSNYSVEGLLTPVTAETRIDEGNRIIYTTLNNLTSIDDLVTCEEGTEIVVESVDNSDVYGTDSKIYLFQNNKIVAVYTLVVCGDLNGDGVCDVLDVSQTALLANEFKEETTVEAYAANGNDYGEVNILSYQNVVNTALS